MQRVNKVLKQSSDPWVLRKRLNDITLKELREWLQWYTPLSYATAAKDTCVSAVIEKAKHMAARL